MVGAGYIGLEMGSVWARLGAEVTVIEFLDRITPGMDLEVAKAFQKILEKQGMTFRLGTKVTGAETLKTKVKLSVEPAAGGDTETIDCDTVLVSIGRRPYTDQLGLEEAGVETDDRGFVEIDDDFQTNVEGIYAIGDCVRGPMLAHKAEDEGVAAAEIISGETGHVNYDVIPGIVYTWPEVASVGKTEEQLKDDGIDYKVGKFPFSANGRARAANETDGYCHGHPTLKLLADAKTDRVLEPAHISSRPDDAIPIGHPQVRSRSCLPGHRNRASTVVLRIEKLRPKISGGRTCQSHPDIRSGQEIDRRPPLAWSNGRTIHITASFSRVFGDLDGCRLRLSRGWQVLSDALGEFGKIERLAQKLPLSISSDDVEWLVQFMNHARRHLADNGQLASLCELTVLFCQTECVCRDLSRHGHDTADEDIGQTEQDQHPRDQPGQHLHKSAEPGCGGVQTNQPAGTPDPFGSGAHRRSAPLAGRSGMIVRS